ncbi:MAG TPA: nuclear transport factor 2 family protein [Burkholderiales bacterium]
MHKALLLAGALLAASAQADDSAAVAAVVARFHSALAAGDSTGVLELLSEDAVIVEAGAVETVADYRRHHLKDDIEFARAVKSKRAAPRVTVEGDAAWAVSSSETAGTFQGRPADSRGAELMVLTRSPPGWKIRAVHWSSRRRPAPP